MDLLIPFFIALFAGSLIFGAVYQKAPWKDALSILVAFWLGMAGCTFVVFYSILITGRYEPLNVIVTTYIFLILSCLLCFYRQGKPFLCFEGTGGAYWFKFFLVILIAWMLTNGLSHHNFYGDWDAWSLWNYRARYLVLSESHWRDIFTYNTQGKNPCFLPYWIVFGWTWIGAQSYAFTFFTAQLLGLIVLATVFFSILNLTKNEDASFLGAIWLASIPYFLTHSISQYADVLTASLIVLNMMLLFRLYRQRTRADAFILGLMLGIMSFCKEEGIISAFFMIFFLILLLRKNLEFYFPFCWGLILTLIPTILVKWWMHTAPAGVNTLYFPYFVEWMRWAYIFQYFLYVLFKAFHGGIWIIPLALLVSRLFKPADVQDRLMTAFLMMFIAVFFLLYVLVSCPLSFKVTLRSSLPSICLALKVFKKSMVLAIRACSSGKVFSVSG